MNSTIGLLSYTGWMIEPGYASRMMPVVMRAIERGSLEAFFQHNREFSTAKMQNLYQGIDAERVHDGSGPGYYLATSPTGKKVAIVTMMGAITKNGDACSFGMRDYTNTLTGIAKQPDISGVVLHFNNAPGGTHDGTPELAAFIRAYTKPVVSFVDGMAASAHYYIASQSDSIVMNKLTPSLVGSIGSLIVSENFQNQIDSGRLPQMEIIRAPQSYNKALFNPLEPLTDSLRAELSVELKNSVTVFIQDVKVGRAGRLANNPEIFTGKTYQAKEAIRLGLADSEGTLADAIAQAGSLQATTRKKSNAYQNNMNLKQRVSSFFQPSKKSAEHGHEDAGKIPYWNEEMSFNTDGSGDGAFCLHPDAQGVDRKFETKADGNQGNEPPVNPLESENEFWALVVEETSAPAEENMSFQKLNVAFRKASVKASTLELKIAQLQQANNHLNTENVHLRSLLEKAPAGTATQVSRSSDPGHEYEGRDKRFLSESDDMMAEIKKKFQPRKN